MNDLLQILVGIVVGVLGICLVLLTVQLRRTAKAVQALAESAREDISAVARDIHEVRLQVDKVATLAEKGLEFPATAGALISTLIRVVTSTLTSGRSPWLEALVTVLKIGLDFFRRPRGAAPTEEATNE